jgi:very-short-patch-repair endonuclease
VRETAATSDTKAVVGRALAGAGVLTRAQLDDLGITRYRLEALIAGGVLTRVGRGYYLLATARPSWSEQVRTAVTRSGGGWASHQTAARLWGFLGVDAYPLHVTVPRDNRNRRQPPGVRLHGHRNVSPGLVSTKDGIRLTTPLRTALDLATQPIPDETLSDFLAHLLAHRYFRAGRLEAFAASQPRHARGVARLQEVLHGLEGGTVDSVFEARVLRLLRRAGLPSPATQLEIRHGGRVVARADFAWPAQRVILEADGYLYHSTPRAFERDRSRRNTLEVAGWRVYQVTPRRLAGDPDGIVREMRRALGADQPDKPEKAGRPVPWRLAV